MHGTRHSSLTVTSVRKTVIIVDRYKSSQQPSIAQLVLFQCAIFWVRWETSTRDCSSSWCVSLCHKTLVRWESSASIELAVPVLPVWIYKSFSPWESVHTLRQILSWGCLLAETTTDIQHQGQITTVSLINGASVISAKRDLTCLKTIFPGVKF